MSDGLGVWIIEALPAVQVRDLSLDQVYWHVYSFRFGREQRQVDP